MADRTSISWCDATHNHWLGCAKVSPACNGCFAEHLMDTRMGRVEWGGPGKGEGTRALTSEANRRKPLAWNKKAAAEPGKTFVFCSSLSDVFDNVVPPEWRRDLFDLIRATPNLTWLLLTKRPGNIVKLFREAVNIGRGPDNEPTDEEAWPRNAAIGCTVVTQEEADRDIPKLLTAKAALKPAFAFLSMEPLLGPVDVMPWLPGCFECAEECGWRSWRRPPEEKCHHCGLIGSSEGEFCSSCGHQDFGTVCPNCDANAVNDHPDTPCIDWIITGGETDQGAHKARPSDPAWFRSLRDQCAAAQVPFHFKQAGEHIGDRDLAIVPDGKPSLIGVQKDLVYRVGKANDLCTLDGAAHDARPEVRA